MANGELIQITGKQVQDRWLKWLDNEIPKHEKDIQQAEGKVNELKELRNQIVHQCEFCGDYIYWYKTSEKEEKVLEHLKGYHVDAYSVRIEEIQEIARKVLEAHSDE